jgi:protein involved in polysaccharide export with SLBB domain
MTEKRRPRFHHQEGLYLPSRMPRIRLSVIGSVMLLGVSSAGGAQARVQPGDRLLFKQWPTSELARVPDTLIVDSRGDAVFPVIGAVRVSSFRVDEVRDSVAAKLKMSIKFPIDIVVLHRVSVGGAVKNPNVFFVDGNTTPSEAIALAGGVSEFGDARKVELVRGGVTSALRDWEHVADAGAPLQSGDRIMVGPRSWLRSNSVQLASLSLAAVSLFISLRQQSR